MKPGDNVKIYCNPFNNTDFEGNARLIKELIPVNIDGQSFWSVNFENDQPEDYYSRWINEKEIIEHE